MKKYILDLKVVAAESVAPGYVLLQLRDENGELPPMRPGQFVQVRIDGEPGTFLRRPISINLVDRRRGELWLLVHVVGGGTRHLASLRSGDTLNVVLPLGNGFTLPTSDTDDGRYLLVGGGVGVAPLLFLGQELAARGARPEFLLGARSAADLLQCELFSGMGALHVTTEDGSRGERGFVTQHSLWKSASAFRRIYTCGPKPMMWAVARLARELGVACEASLENMMACGLGACLCCVKNTVDGHVCVCSEGPVFDTSRLVIAPT